MQINRLFEIVYILLRQKTVTAKQLSAQFGVSQRTIYRDIDLLSIAGIPIYTEKGSGGGIKLLPEFVLNKSILSEKEQSDILSALQALSGVEDVETSQVLKKLSAIFNKDTENWLQVDLSSWDFSGKAFFKDFKKAILERRITEFDYYSSHGEKTHRRVEPVQLWFKSKAWYIIGFCLTRQDYRTFKLTRIKNLKITDKIFLQRNQPIIYPNFDPSEDKEQYQTIKLKINPELTYRVYDEFDEQMLAKQPDGSFVVTISMPEDEWIHGYILSFGEHIEVLEPESMRNAIKNKAKKIVKKYL